MKILILLLFLLNAQSLEEHKAVAYFGYTATEKVDKDTLNSSFNKKLEKLFEALKKEATGLRRSESSCYLAKLKKMSHGSRSISYNEIRCSGIEGIFFLKDEREVAYVSLSTSRISLKKYGFWIYSPVVLCEAESQEGFTLKSQVIKDITKQIKNCLKVKDP